MRLRIATLQRLVILAVVALAATYLGVLRPLEQRVRDEDAPLKDLQEQLARASLDAGLPRGTDFQTLGDRLLAVRSASATFSAAEREARPRLQHPPEIRARLEEPFQYVEFLNDSQRRLEDLAALAQKNRTTLTHGLARGFPRFQPELERPELLWVQLAMVNRTVRTAILAGVREISEVSVEPLPLYEPPDPNQPPLFGPAPAPPATNAWSTLRLHVTAVGNVDALSKVMLALALTPDELKRTGLPEELAGQPALFLEKVLLRRHQLEAAEQAQLDLVVSTVVSNETF